MNEKQIAWIEGIIEGIKICIRLLERNAGICPSGNIDNGSTCPQILARDLKEKLEVLERAHE